MFGLFAAFGPISREYASDRIKALWIPGSKMEIVSNRVDYKIARFVPENHQNIPEFYSSGDGKLQMALDGYVITESAQKISGLEAQVGSLIESFQGKGIAGGLQDLVAGSYVMTVVDTLEQKAHVITDPAGSLPVYIGKTEKGWLVSTNATALARSGHIDTTPDKTACAEWVLFAYALGERYPAKGIQALAPGTVLSIDLRSGIAERKGIERIWETPLGEKSPPVENAAEAFRQACARLQRIDPSPANLQSSGMDSRLITASLPAGYEPACYTYGDPDAHEIQIARRIAETRGSRWFHTWQHGDEVADAMDPIFHESGIIMWPDRRFAAEKMASNGHAGVLDGLCGDVMLGGSYYGHDKYFGSYKRIKRLFAMPNDVKYTDVAGDRIAEAIFTDILQINDPGYFKDMLNDETIKSILGEKDNILQDIYNCIQTSKPVEDSMAMLWRNFLLATRAVHYTNQQGVVCKRFINVYYPFTNDRDFSRIAMSIRPEDAMYRRYYVRLFRRCHPRFAEIPYGDTLIPIRRPALNHKLSKILISKNLTIPYLTGTHHGKARDPNGWAIWLEESSNLREYVQSCLASAGMLDKTRADVYFNEIASGYIKGGGKLFHLASIAKWMTLPKTSH
jgi:asparagine synthetase B (glutamine-hydrolysing)